MSRVATRALIGYDERLSSRAWLATRPGYGHASGRDEGRRFPQGVIFCDGLRSVKTMKSDLWIPRNLFGSRLVAYLSRFLFSIVIIVYARIVIVSGGTIQIGLICPKLDAVVFE